MGITSACAEQTSCRWRRRPRCRDHLRVCGADSAMDHLRVCGADRRSVRSRLRRRGSPPRVRSRLFRLAVDGGHQGITSACAEQTSVPACSSWPSRDHLRVCGADVPTLMMPGLPVGSPPRVRSRLPRVVEGVRPVRITSACAEQT